MLLDEVPFVKTTFSVLFTDLGAFIAFALIGAELKEVPAVLLLFVCAVSKVILEEFSVDLSVLSSVSLTLLCSGKAIV